ncbi:MAG: methyltransferase domain-containing protein [Caldilineaceae bacterium]|nr:methyltransferase domain-containing protein [Caldilineaceae bacterium]
MTTSTQWQLAREAAERYQSILTPAILGPFARTLVGFATLQPNEWVVDVGCGTGAAARYAAQVVGPSGRVTGVDINASMLEVARSLPAVPGAAIKWQEASATQLPLPDHSAGSVLCAQTLQFLPEKAASLTEMRRVVKPGGRVALSLWRPIQENPYFHALVEAMASHIGPDTAAGLNAAFALYDSDAIYSLLKESGFQQVEMVVTQIDLPFPELAAFIPRHISATPMAAGFERAGAAAQQRVIQDVTGRLVPYVTAGHA